MSITLQFGFMHCLTASRFSPTALVMLWYWSKTQVKHMASVNKSQFASCEVGGATRKAAAYTFLAVVLK